MARMASGRSATNSSLPLQHRSVIHCHRLAELVFERGNVLMGIGLRTVVSLKYIRYREIFGASTRSLIHADVSRYLHHDQAT